MRVDDAEVSVLNVVLGRPDLEVANLWSPFHLGVLRRASSSCSDLRYRGNGGERDKFDLDDGGGDGDIDLRRRGILSGKDSSTVKAMKMKIGGNCIFLRHLTDHIK